MEASGGGAGPAPFLLKTYDMVDDSATDDVVSWSSNRNSFVVWNPPEFSRVLLPTYFKHNNFSSFIRQLNTYGFRKSDPERWEFANEDFLKDQKHLLKNIHRRKPIHSHSNPQGSAVDPERAALDEEIEKLSHDKEALQASISHIKQQLTAKNQFENAFQRLNSIEKRQDNLQNFLEKSVQDPAFIDYLVQKIESMDFAAYNKKRRLPEVVHSQPALENSFLENHSSSRPEFENPFHQDFSNKLRLELSPAVSDINLISNSTQSSNEDGETSHKKISEGELRVPQMRREELFLAPEALELTDTGTSFGFKMDSSFSRKPPSNGSPGFHSFQPNMSSSEEDDGRMSCRLNLSLASLPLQENSSPYPPDMTQLGQGMRKSPESRIGTNEKQLGFGVSLIMNNMADDDNQTLPPSREVSNNQETAETPAKVNDVFWEQFLTERPGDSEEASSNFRNTYNEQNDGRFGQGISRSARNAERLTL